MKYTQGICGDGAAILRDGEMISIDEILSDLNNSEVELLRNQWVYEVQTLVTERDKLRAELERVRQEIDKLFQTNHATSIDNSKLRLRLIDAELAKGQQPDDRDDDDELEQMLMDRDMEADMSVELPKPVACRWKPKSKNGVEYAWFYGHHDPAERNLSCEDPYEQENVFTESQLLAHAAKCVEDERAKHAALIEVADGLLNAVTAGAEADTPEMMEWIAARCVRVHGDDKTADFIVTLTERAKEIRKKIANYIEARNTTKPKETP